MILALVILSLVIYQSGVWNNLVVFIAKSQLQFHKLLNEQVILISRQPDVFGFGLIGISFMYGVFHALGPGHGKAIIVSYLASNPLSKRKSCLLAITAAIFQALTAILLVSILSLILKYKFIEVEANANQITLVGYSLLLCLGVYIAVKTLKQLYKSNISASSCSSCCGSGKHVKANNNSQFFLIALGIGLRPCSGALIILVSSALLGIYNYGILGTFAMSLGTALCTCLIALASLYARDLLNHFLTVYTKKQNKVAYGLYIQLFGSVLIMLFAWSLLNTNNMLSNPLLTY
jgi:ABC-type nickel/cobalt efflux system permease component RcnA